MAEVGAVGSTPSASGVQRRDNARAQGGQNPADEPIDFSPFGPDEKPDPEMVKAYEEQEARNKAEAARIQSELKAQEERQRAYEEEHSAKMNDALNTIYDFQIKMRGMTPEQASKFLTELRHNLGSDDAIIQEAEKLRQEEKNINEMYNNLWWVKLWRWITGK